MKTRLLSIFVMTRLFFLFCVVCVNLASHGKVEANSDIGHNSVAIYTFYMLEKDDSFMPEIKDTDRTKDRTELKGKGIEKIKKFDDLTNAQKAFIHGVNLPDALPLAKTIHSEMPMEVLNAMYSISDKVPLNSKAKTEIDKTLVTDMQRYMTWGSKLHLEMDRIAHQNLPDPRTSNGLTMHNTFEKSRDKVMMESLLDKMNLSDKQRTEMRDIIKEIGAVNSNRYTDNKVDIRDDFVNLILDYIEEGKDVQRRHIPDTLERITEGPALVNSRLAALLMPTIEAKVPWINIEKELIDPTLEMLGEIDLTVPPTEDEMANQVNLDDPDPEKKPIGLTDKGKKLLAILGTPAAEVNVAIKKVGKKVRQAEKDREARQDKLMQKLMTQQKQTGGVVNKEARIIYHEAQADFYEKTADNDLQWSKDIKAINAFSCPGDFQKAFSQWKEAFEELKRLDVEISRWKAKKERQRALDLKSEKEEEKEEPAEGDTNSLRRNFEWKTVKTNPDPDLDPDIPDFEAQKEAQLKERQAWEALVELCKEKYQVAWPVPPSIKIPISIFWGKEADK